MNERLISQGIHLGDDTGRRPCECSHTKFIDSGNQFAVQMKRRQP